MQEKGFTSLIFIIIVLVVSGLVIGGGFYLKSKQISLQTHSVSSVAPTVVSTSPSTFVSIPSQDINTSSWKTYTNTKFSYLIMYPTDWIIRKPTSEDPLNILGMGKGSEDQGFLYGGQSILIEVTSTDKTNLDYIKENIAPNSNPKNLGSININGFQGEKWSFNDNADQDNYAIFLVKDGKHYVLIKEFNNISQGKDYNLEVNQTISTFKFTN